MNLVMLIYLPLQAGAFAEVCKAVAKAYPKAQIRPLPDDPSIVQVLVPAASGDGRVEGSLLFPAQATYPPRIAL